MSQKEFFLSVIKGCEAVISDYNLTNEYKENLERYSDKSRLGDLEYKASQYYSYALDYLDPEMLDKHFDTNKIESIIYGEGDLIERIFEKLDDADQDYYNEIFDDLGI